jgi:hypothetical protein
LIATTKRLTNKYEYEQRPLAKSNVGGVLQLPTETYQKVNGYSNRFGGWGLEDNNMAQRLKRLAGGYRVLPVSVGQYRELYHDRVPHLDANEQYARNWDYRGDYQSGLSDLQYTIVNASQPYMAGTTLRIQRYLVAEK